MKTPILVLLLLLIVRLSVAQTTIKEEVLDGDSITHIYLPTLLVLPPMQFKNDKEAVRYSKLIYNVKKAYPYSKLVKIKLQEIDKNISNYKTDKEKKVYLKEKEKELRAQFEGQLKNLTFTQGKILLKLIDRETGRNTYSIVKELKGSLSAVFWQSIALVFGENLKSEYDAKGEDILIEDIIIRIENGQL